MSNPAPDFDDVKAAVLTLQRLHRCMTGRHEDGASWVWTNLVEAEKSTLHAVAHLWGTVRHAEVLAAMERE